MKQFDPAALPKIPGQKVCLRPITMEDTDLIVKWRNSPAVMNNFIFRGEMTAQIHREWMRNKVVSGQVVQYIIEDAQTGQPVGSVYYRDLDHIHESAEYGIFLGEDSARGRGLGSETARLFVKFGLEYLGLHRISLRVLEGNDGAYRTYEKAGFRKEGVFRDMVKLDGQYRNVIFMAVIAE
jgi:RimJ/RimL family protein N-acetyltransferase